MRNAYASRCAVVFFLVSERFFFFSALVRLKVYVMLDWSRIAGSSNNSNNNIHTSTLLLIGHNNLQ